MITSTEIDSLKELELLTEYENNELTILRLSYFLNIPFSKVEKILYKKGYRKVIINTTLVDSEWLPVILGLKPRKRRVYKKKRSPIKNIIKIGPKPKNKTLVRNWLKRKQELKDSGKKTIKPIFISTPMGGKVK